MRDVAGQRGGRSPWTTGDVGGEKEHRSLLTTNRPADAEERMARLVRTIEGEIVPRLILARHVSPTAPERETLIKAPDAADVKELVRLLLAHDAVIASGYVEAVRHRGASLELVCMELLAPAARELGLLWEQDECDFMQVTVGLCRLHQVLREISIEFRPEDAAVQTDRSCLLAPIPGEQHTFGIMLVAQFLRRANWDVWHEFPDTLTDILQIVRANWFAVVGLSVGCDRRLDEVAAVIRAVRSASRNRAVGILVGGPLLVANPQAAASMGADATALDGMHAVLQAECISRQLATMN